MNTASAPTAPVDAIAAIDEYLDRADWRVNANANQGYSLGGLILNIAGKLTANYWLERVLAPEVALAHRQGDLHIHDLDMLSGYCAGWSLRTLLQNGFNGIPGKVEPPRRATCPRPAARSSTSSAPCKTNGPARRPSAPSTPIWPLRQKTV